MHLLRSEWDWLRDLPWGNDPQAWACAGAAVIKRSKSRFAFLWPGDTSVFIKRYLARRFGARWFSWLLGTRSAREARTLLKLRSAGIPAPEPLAVINPIFPLGCKANYLIQERLQGNDLMRIVQLSPENAGVLLATRAEELGHLLARLHSIRFFHPDAVLCNFFWDTTRKRITIIDVDNGRFLPRILLHHRRKNLRQIVRSALDLTDDREWVPQLYEAYRSSSGIHLDASVVP